eukprot:g5455.t1
MVSLGGRPWVTDLKAPVAMAVVLLAVAAWKATLGADTERSLPPPGSGGSSNGSVGKSSSGSTSCGCECHSKGGTRRRRSNSHSGDQAKANGTTTSGTSNSTSTSTDASGNSQVCGPDRGRGTNSATRPAQRCCSCPAAIAATAAATALGRRSGSVRSTALAGTPRRGRNDRRVEPNGGNGRQRRSKTRDGYSSGEKAGGPHSQAGHSRQNVAGHGKRGAAGGAGGTGSAGAAAGAAAAVVEGATVETLTVLRRMCHFPGVILRSGFFFQRVTTVSLPRQGLLDEDIPASVARLAGPLRKVDLSGNRLTAVPPGVLGLGPELEELNLGNNDIAELPPEVAQLSGLLSFNLAGNRLTRLPPEIGRLSALRRLGLKGNALVRLPASVGDLSHLSELYLTGNILEALPDEIVKLRRLKKLQMSFNNLRSLPHGMEAMRSLELCRIAVNPGLAVVPEGLKFAERLAWVSLAGSAWCARAAEKRRRPSFPVIPREEVVLGERLGSGASGDVYAGVYRGRDVAVKVFKSDVGPDGNARDELDVACAVDHPNLTKSLGVVRGSNAKTSGGRSVSATDAAPEAAKSGRKGGGCGGRGVENSRWLVMERVVGQPLAEKPDFSSVLRCRWGPGRRFEPVLVLAVLLQVARAMSYLHEKSICHGDLYAHNVLVDGETGAAVLCDFGASFFYPSDQHESSMLEGTEVRAFGLMARDMACRSAGCEWILQDLVPSCLQADANHRPSFHEIINQLHAELMQSVEPSSPMVTSAKSLHSLLDRPDIVAERGRLRSTERRLDPSSSSSRGGGQTADGGGGDGSIGNSNPTATSGGSRSGSVVDLVGGTIGGVADGIVTYKRAGGGGVGGRGRGGPGGTVGSRPLVMLGGVQEGTADDEGDEDGDGGEGEEGEEGEEKAKPREGGAGLASSASAPAAAAVPAGSVAVAVPARAGTGLE